MMINGGPTKDKHKAEDQKNIKRRKKQKMGKNHRSPDEKGKQEEVLCNANSKSAVKIFQQG